MMRSLSLCVLLLCLSVPGLVRAAETTFTDIFAGKVCPLTVPLKEMGAGWTAAIPAVLNGQPQNDGREPAVDDTVRNSTLLFTHGETVTCAGVDFTIAYRLSLVNLDVPTTPQDALPNPTPVSPTPDSVASLALINAKADNTLAGAAPFEMRLVQQAYLTVKACYDRESRRSIRDASIMNLREVLLAVHSYANGHKEILPDTKTWSQDIAVNKELLAHPASREPYVYNPNLSKKSLARINNSSSVPMLWEASADADGLRIVAYLDGHVKTLAAAEWVAVKKRAGIKE